MSHTVQAIQDIMRNYQERFNAGITMVYGIPTYSFMLT